MTNVQYLSWLNQPPRVVRKNLDGSEYVPISCVQEDLQDGYKGKTKMELLREIVVKSGLAGVGRLHYKHPVSGEWLFQDGSASIPFQKGMRLDYPALGGHIMLSCAKKIGTRFGQKLNRERDDAPLPIIQVGEKEQETDDEITKEFEALKQRLAAAKSYEDAKALLETNKTFYHSHPDLKKIVERKRIT